MSFYDEFYEPFFDDFFGAAVIVDGYPLPSDVRFGVVYANGALTGTLTIDADLLRYLEILSKLSKSKFVFANPCKPKHFCITRGDGYGITRQKFQFNVGMGVDGKPYRFTIKPYGSDETTPALLQVTGTVDGMIVTPPLTSTQTAALPITVNREYLNYDLEIEIDTNDFETPFRGTLAVNADVTTPTDRP